MIEYRVKRVERFIVTRYESHETSGALNTGGVSTLGEYPSGDTAYAVAYALCRQEHEKSGEPIGSMNFVYPGIPDGDSVEPMS